MEVAFRRTYLGLVDQGPMEAQGLFVDGVEHEMRLSSGRRVDVLADGR